MTSLDLPLMRRRDRAITDPQILEAIIRQCQVCRVGMCRGDQPYVVPLNFGYENRRIYCHSARTGFKLDILANNPRVCVLFDLDHKLLSTPSPDGWTMHYRSVMAYGKAELVSSPEEKQGAFDIIFRHLAGRTYPLTEQMLKGVSIIRIEIELMTGKENC